MPDPASAGQTMNPGVGWFTVCRVTLQPSGSTSCRLLEVPVWMFDQALSVRWLALPIAYADFSCALALAKLLEEAGTPLQGADITQHLSLTKRVGEMSMPRQFKTYQFDLFSIIHSGKTPAVA